MIDVPRSWARTHCLPQSWDPRTSLRMLRKTFPSVSSVFCEIFYVKFTSPVRMRRFPSSLIGLLFALSGRAAISLFNRSQYYKTLRHWWNWLSGEDFTRDFERDTMLYLNEDPSNAWEHLYRQLCPFSWSHWLLSTGSHWVYSFNIQSVCMVSWRWVVYFDSYLGHIPHVRSFKVGPLSDIAYLIGSYFCKYLLTFLVLW